MAKLPLIDDNTLQEFCTKNDISFLGVFGSFVRGEATPDSDIDLIVRFSRTKSLLDLVRIEGKLSEILGKKVDLLTEASISPYLRDRIRAETETVFCKTG